MDARTHGRTGQNQYASSHTMLGGDIIKLGQQGVAETGALNLQVMNFVSQGVEFASNGICK